MPARYIVALAFIAALAAATSDAHAAAPSCDDPPELLSLPAEHQLSLAPVLALLPAPPPAALCALEGGNLGDCRIDREHGGPIPPAPNLDTSRTPALLATVPAPRPGVTPLRLTPRDLSREHPGYAPGIDRPPRP